MNFPNILRTISLLKPKLEQVTCGECNNSHIVQDFVNGELICQNCGYVISTTLIDQTPEWKSFDYQQGDALSRVGAPTTLSIHDMGLSTTISWQNKDHAGRNLSSEERDKIFRLRKWDNRSKKTDSTDRHLADALSSITMICSKLNLSSNIVETSSLLYRSVLKRGLVKGRTIQGIAAASVYMACRQCEIIRSLEEIAQVSNITKKEAAKNYRFLLNSFNSKVPLVTPGHHISKIISKLELSGETEILAIKILNSVSKMKMTVGRTPSGMASACVYISTIIRGDKITQSEIAREAQVTEVTIRNRYKELIKNLQFTVTL